LSVEVETKKLDWTLETIAKKQGARLNDVGRSQPIGRKAPLSGTGELMHR